MDGVGFHQGRTSYSYYECSDEICEAAEYTFSQHEELQEGEIWYSGDHMIFVQNGIPAIALTSEHGMTGLAQISHTPEDKPELVDSSKLVTVTTALTELISAIDSI
jgi:aminopeptidase YwaD